MTTWAEYNSRTAAFRAQEMNAAKLAQNSEAAAASSAGPDADLASAYLWQQASNAAAAIDSNRKQYLAEGVEATAMPWPAPSTPWKPGTPAGAAQLDPAYPLAGSAIAAPTPGGKSAHDRAWYYSQYATLHYIEADKKGAVPSGPIPPYQPRPNQPPGPYQPRPDPNAPPGTPPPGTDPLGEAPAPPPEDAPGAGWIAAGLAVVAGLVYLVTRRR